MNSNIPFVTNLLKYTYGLVPIVAGLDKFTNILTDWTNYISPGFAEVLPISVGSFMMMVGVIEITAGILVFYKTEIGAYVVMTWLISISCTLLFSLSYIDVAVRDIVMAIGAFTLARLAQKEPKDLGHT